MDFKIKFTHNSTAIEGNTLTLMETTVVLDDGVSVLTNLSETIIEKYELVKYENENLYIEKSNNKIFIVHGRDDKKLKSVELFIDELDQNLSSKKNSPVKGNQLFKK